MTRISTLTTAFHHSTGSSSQHTKARKSYTKHTYWKERNKLSLFIGYKIVYEKSQVIYKYIYIVSSTMPQDIILTYKNQLFFYKIAVNTWKPQFKQ